MGAYLWTWTREAWIEEMVTKKLLLVLLAFLPIGTLAQWKVGAGCGPSLNFYDSQQQEWEYRNNSWGIAAGGFGQYNFKNYIGVRVEINWVQKNNYKYFSYYSQETGIKTINNYLQMPIMATGSIKFGKIGLFLNAGIYGAYWLSSSASSDMEIHESTRINTDYNNRFDFGLVGGFGVEYLINKHIALQLEARCYYSTVSAKKELDGIKNPQYNTAFVFQPSICYLF